MTRSFTAQRRLCLAVVLLAATGCTVVDARTYPGFHGFMVLGERATKFGLVPGDALEELAPGRIPSALRQELEREARRIRQDPRCIRYFTSGEATVVFTDESCGLRRSSDMFAFLLYRRDGDRWVRDTREFDAAVRMCPVYRHTLGWASERCSDER